VVVVVAAVADKVPVVVLVVALVAVNVVVHLQVAVAVDLVVAGDKGCVNVLMC
jgi:hypothetical protein